MILKKILICVSLMILTVIAATTNPTYAFYNEIMEDVIQLTDDGTLPSFHTKYMNRVEYQMIYTKQIYSLNNLNHFGSWSEEYLLDVMNMYKTKTNQVWEDVLTNLDIAPQYLEPDRILGIYWDSSVDKPLCFMYLFWTSRYFANEFFDLSQIEINNVTYKKYEIQQNNYYSNSWWEEPDSFHFPEYDLSIHRTAIGGYAYGNPYGIPLSSSYHITSFFAKIDTELAVNVPNSEKDQEAYCFEEVYFDLGKFPTRDGRKICQLVTHAYEYITDCEAQSYFDLGFGGFKHHVYFNTKIVIDKIYRVDVIYTVTSENKKWYEFWIKTEERRIVKSLTAERKQGGLFNLFGYQGFKEGDFSSHLKNAVTFKYELHLNYDATGWNLFENIPVDEANYKLVKDFRILRLNYLKDDMVYDVEIKMDSIDGDTKNIFDQDLIGDENDPFWKIKDDYYKLIEKLKEGFGNAAIPITIVLSILIGALVLYILSKVFKVINKIFNIKGD